MKITPKQALEFIPYAMFKNLSVMLTGSPGTGKSDIIRQIAKKYGLYVIDIRLSTIDPVDMSGALHVDKDLAHWVPMAVFPYEDTSVPDGYKGFLIFLDEMNSAPMSVQAAAYRLTLDREVCNKKLHPATAIVAAGNLATDGAIVNRIGTAMQSRMIHLELHVSVEDWMLWASQNGIDYRTMSYIHQVPGNLMNFDPKHNDKTFACPRTWEFCSRLIKGIPTSDLQHYTALLAGTISEGVAREFIAFSNIRSKMPTYPDILADPKNAIIGNDPAALCTTAYMVAAHMVKEEADTVMDYLERLPAEYTSICLQTALMKDPFIQYEKKVNKWATLKGAANF